VSLAPTRRDGAAEALAGLLAAAALSVSAIALAYRPLRLAPFGIVLALVAAGIGGRHARLAAVAVGVGGLCFAVGMAVAILTNNPIY
jgi:hypothetical protein